MIKKIKSEVINFRIDSDTLHLLKTYCKENEFKTSDVIREALNLFLNPKASNKGSEPREWEEVIDALEARVRALEGKNRSKLNPTKNPPLVVSNTKIPSWEKQNEKNTKDIIRIFDLENKDLLSLDELAILTGYSKSTLSSKMSREGIKSTTRVNGNRGGLYPRDEVISKIGYKQ